LFIYQHCFSGSHTSTLQKRSTKTNEKDEYIWVSQKLSSALEKWIQQCEWAQFNEPMLITVVRDHWLGSIELPAMPSSERRVVHEYLREREDVDTISEGREPNRRLVVEPLDD
jgi:hypothetical protein